MARDNFDRAAAIIGGGVTGKDILQTMGWYFDDSSYLYFEPEHLVRWYRNHLAAEAVKMVKK